MSTTKTTLANYLGILVIVTHKTCYHQYLSNSTMARSKSECRNVSYEGLMITYFTKRFFLFEYSLNPRAKILVVAVKDQYS